MLTISEHRGIVKSMLAGMQSAHIWRDVTPVDTPWGPLKRSAALYRRDTNEWRMVVDEFGAPTGYGRETYRNFAKVKPTKKLVRVANKNQLLVQKNSVTQLDPLTWTTQFVELSALYAFLGQSQSMTPGLLAQDSVGNAILSRLVCLIGGDTERRELVSGLKTLARGIEGLPQELQALLIVFDSDLGKPGNPFVRINDGDPSELNKVSMWRCWVADAFTEEALGLLAPPVAVTGWDVYKRPVWAPTPAARIRQLCVLEVDLPIESNPVLVVEHEVLWSKLQELLELCRKDQGVAWRFVDRITKEDRLAAFTQNAEFWLKFWSHHFQETLIGDQIVPDRIYDIQIEETGPIPFFQFKRAPLPFWEKGISVDARQLLSHWCLPFCPIGEAGEWDKSLNLFSLSRI